MIIQTQINHQCKISSKYIDGTMPLHEVFHLIKEGDEKSKLLIQKARSAGKGSNVYEQIKKYKLTSFLFNYRFSKTVAKSNIISDTGLLYLDIDNIDTDDELIAVKNRLKELPFILMCCKSLSGKGLQILASVKGMTVSNYPYFAAYIQHKYGHHHNPIEGFKWDSKAFNPTQKTVLSFDEQLYYNNDCSTLYKEDVLEYCKSFDLVRQDEKVQSGHLNLTPQYQGNGIAPKDRYSTPLFTFKDPNKTYFNDRYKYADPDKLYSVYPSGIDINVLYLNKGQKVKEGYRRTVFYTIACKYIRINGMDFEKVHSYMLWVRDNYSENPKSFSDKQIMEVVNSALKGYANEKIKTRKGYVFFPTTSPFSASEKRTISNKEMGKIKTDRTISILSNLYKPGMKQSELIAIAPVKERTVKSYWAKDGDGNVYFRRPIRKVKTVKDGRVNVKGNK